MRQRLTALHRALHRRYVTLEDGRYGRLVGTGDPSSIRIDGAAGHAGLLAFHGYAGTPNEVRILTDAAARLGLFARAPRLAGHDDDVRRLLKRGWDDWVADATDALFELAAATSRRVIVAGLSMGALLAAHLAARYPERVADRARQCDTTSPPFTRARLDFLRICSPVRQ
jgi:alpha-beta hydrolase superfamily lysophospholipase